MKDNKQAFTCSTSYHRGTAEGASDIDVVVVKVFLFVVYLCFCFVVIVLLRRKERAKHILSYELRQKYKPSFVNLILSCWIGTSVFIFL